MTDITDKPDLSRRKFLQSTAAVTGAVAGSGALSAPMLWAQNIRDITISWTGPSFSVISDIAEKASEDLGFRIVPQSVESTNLMPRIINQPETLEIVDMEYWALAKVWRSGNFQAIDKSKIEAWDRITPIMKDGKNFDGSDLSRQGILPFKVMYLESEDATSFATEETDIVSTVPTIYNADTLGIRPDLIDRPIESYAELFNPEFRGKTALVNVPGTGILDAANAFEAMGSITYGDKGNMTREEIDFTIDSLIELKRAGQFRAFWVSFDESVNLMAAGEVVIQSMWAPAVTAVKARGIPCVYQGMKEGYRAWGSGIGLMGHLDGMKRDAAYEFMNWALSGWHGGFIGRQGYYSSIPETAREFMTENEWGYWYEGQPATEQIVDPYGAVMDNAGARRDGGSFEDRIGNISVWNTVMDEELYMVRRWNEFISA